MSDAPSDHPTPSKARERRLWAWAAVAIGGIYLTIPFGSALAREPMAEEIASSAFAAGMVLVGLSVLTQGLRIRPRGVEIGVGLGLVAVYALVFSRLALPERTHLIEYSVLALLVYEALKERGRSGRRVPAPWLVALAGTVSVGVLDESIQLLMPTRVFDPVDILFNSLAAVGAIIAAGVLDRLRHGRA